MNLSRPLFPSACVLAALVFLAAPHTTVAQNLAQQTVQAEAVAAQEGAPPQRAQSYASALAQAFGERGDVGALTNAAQQLAAQRPADAAAIAAAASVFVSGPQVDVIAAAVTAVAPAFAADISRAVGAVHPDRSQSIANAVAAVPGTDRNAIMATVPPGDSDSGFGGGGGGAGGPGLGGYGFGGGGGGGGGGTATTSTSPTPAPAPTPRPDTQ